MLTEREEKGNFFGAFSCSPTSQGYWEDSMNTESLAEICAWMQFQEKYFILNNGSR